MEQANKEKINLVAFMMERIDSLHETVGESASVGKACARNADRTKKFSVSFGCLYSAPMMRFYLSLLVTSICSFCTFSAQTEYVFLVTADGIRHQEVFAGVDPALMSDQARTNSGTQS